MGIPDEFSYFQQGIYTGGCKYNSINHAMDAVGYGTDEETGIEYVIIRNSWGTWWGEGGYAKVEIGEPFEGGKCHMWSWAAYPKIQNQ